MAVEITADQSAKKLMEHFNKGKKIHDVFIKNFRDNYQIFGKTIREWEHKFKVSIPTDPDPAVCKTLDMNLMNLHQEAAFYYAASAAYAQALRKGNESEYHSRLAAIVAEFKQNSPGVKLPARGTLEDLARAGTEDVESALANAELQETFWKNIMNHLNTCRRFLENATINSGIQIKMDNHHKGNLYDTNARRPADDSPF